MNGINVTNTAQQADGSWKISYNATYDSSAHIEGFIFLPNSDYLDLTGAKLPAKVSQVLIKSLENTIEAGTSTESEETK